MAVRLSEFEKGGSTSTGFKTRAEGRKGAGFFGELQLSDGGSATEFSIGVQLQSRGGQETNIPTLVPTLTQQERDLMINDIIPNRKRIPDTIVQKAVDHANKRVREGFSPFFEDLQGIGLQLLGKSGSPAIADGPVRLSEFAQEPSAGTEVFRLSELSKIQPARLSDFTRGPEGPEDKNILDDFLQSFAETGENLKIGGISLAASALENIKRRGIQAVGGVVPAFEETIRPLFEPVTPQAEQPDNFITTQEDIALSPGVVIPAGTQLLKQDITDFVPKAPQGAGAGAEAFGTVARIPGIAAKLLRGKQAELTAAQEPVTFSSAPLTRTARAVVQSGVPSLAAAIGVSIITGNPLIGLAVLGEIEGGAAFQQQLEAGASVGKASILGELSEAAEIGGEMLVFPRVLGAATKGISLKKGIRLIGENATQEGVTGFNQTFLEVFGTETAYLLSQP